MTDPDVAAVEKCRQQYEKIRTELSKAIVGQDAVIEQVLIAMLAGGHALLEGVPGLAKTLLVGSLAQSLHLTFKRIQFTPDLMPSDVTGAEVRRHLRGQLDRLGVARALVKAGVKPGDKVRCGHFEWEW